MTINYKSLSIFIVLLAIEVLIALYIKDGFIRFIFGDFIAVITLYYFFKSFLKIKPLYLALSVLIISYFIEFLQLTHILEFLNLQENTILRIVFGATFSIIDLLAYTLGICTVLLIENNKHKIF